MAKIVDPGLLRAAAEQKNDEQILLQIKEKNCVTLEVPYHKICDSHYTKIRARVDMYGLRNEKCYHYIILYISSKNFRVTDYGYNRFMVPYLNCNTIKCERTYSSFFRCAETRCLIFREQKVFKRDRTFETYLGKKK